MYCYSWLGWVLMCFWYLFLYKILGQWLWPGANSTLFDFIELQVIIHALGLVWLGYVFFIVLLVEIFWGRSVWVFVGSAISSYLKLTLSDSSAHGRFCDSEPICVIPEFSYCPPYTEPGYENGSMLERGILMNLYVGPLLILPLFC